MISFRAAQREDCRAIAELYSISSDGVADYIWAKSVKPGEEILDVGERRYEREDSVFSYKNCTIVEVSGETAGMMVSFPMKTSGEVDEDPVLAPYSRLEEDNSYYICGMALFPEHRGKGIGHQFLALANQQAKLRRFNKLSLIVFEENAGAKRLYEEFGFKEVGRETIVAHPFIPHTGDAILMVKTLEE
ncbi:MAG: GNAT family N-acetyltransferase [Porticoccus sp.]